MSAATTVNVASAAIPENKTKKVSPSLIAVYVVLVVLAVVWLLPVIYTVTTSFKSVAEFTSNAFNFLPAKWVLDNYMTLIEASASYPVLNWLGNSLIISTVFAVLSVCIVALAGFGYSRLNFKYRDTLFFVLLLISMFPAVVNMIPQYRIIASLGWVNTYWACIIPGLGNVANIFLVRNFMKGIPKELDEAAEIDGATDFQNLHPHHAAGHPPDSDRHLPVQLHRRLERLPVADLGVQRHQQDAGHRWSAAAEQPDGPVQPDGLPDGGHLHGHHPDPAAVPVRAEVLPAVPEHHLRPQGLIPAE